MLLAGCRAPSADRVMQRPEAEVMQPGPIERAVVAEEVAAHYRDYLQRLDRGEDAWAQMRPIVTPRLWDSVETARRRDGLLQEDPLLRSQDVGADWAQRVRVRDIAPPRGEATHLPTDRWMLVEIGGDTPPGPHRLRVRLEWHPPEGATADGPRRWRLAAVTPQ